MQNKKFSKKDIMDKINLITKTKPEEGVIEYFWFENLKIGLQRTCFHRIIIPLKPFDSGLDYMKQPEKTEIVVDWIKLDLENQAELNNIELSSDKMKDLEASVYIGGDHNPIDVKNLKILNIAENKFSVSCDFKIDFEAEGVGENEEFKFETELKYIGEFENTYK